jgi:hypothetical protein
MVPLSKIEEMYEDMVTARHYEERLQEEYLEGKQPAFDISAGPIPGELHLAAGHEPAAVGVCHHLHDDDTVTAPHRPHHVAVAKGVDLERMTAEIFGDAPDCRVDVRRLLRRLHGPDLQPDGEEHVRQVPTAKAVGLSVDSRSDHQNWW